MLLGKGINQGCGVGRGVVQDDEPEDVGLRIEQVLQMSAQFNGSFALVDGVQAFAGRIDQAAEQRVPGIGQAGRIDGKAREE